MKLYLGQRIATDETNIRSHCIQTLYCATLYWTECICTLSYIYLWLCSLEEESMEACFGNLQHQQVCTRGESLSHYWWVLYKTEREMYIGNCPCNSDNGRSTIKCFYNYFWCVQDICLMRHDKAVDIPTWYSVFGKYKSPVHTEAFVSHRLRGNLHLIWFTIKHTIYNPYSSI